MWSVVPLKNNHIVVGRGADVSLLVLLTQMNQTGRTDKPGKQQVMVVSRGGLVVCVYVCGIGVGGVHLPDNDIRLLLITYSQVHFLGNS